MWMMMLLVKGLICLQLPNDRPELFQVLSASLRSLDVAPEL